MNALGSVVFLAIVAALIDLPYLMTVQPFFSKMIRRIQGYLLEFRMIPAVIVQLAIGQLSLLPTNYTEAFLLGAATQAIQDFTNYATIKNYSPFFAVMDTLWGGILFTLIYMVRIRFLS